MTTVMTINSHNEDMLPTHMRSTMCTLEKLFGTPCIKQIEHNDTLVMWWRNNILGLELLVQIASDGSLNYHMDGKGRPAVQGPISSAALKSPSECKELIDISEWLWGPSIIVFDLCE